MGVFDTIMQDEYSVVEYLNCNTMYYT